jgi:hypothetical protein
VETPGFRTRRARWTSGRAALKAMLPAGFAVMRSITLLVIRLPPELSFTASSPVQKEWPNYIGFAVPEEDMK